MRSLFMGRKIVLERAMDYYLLTEELGEAWESYGVEIAYTDGENAKICGITLSQRQILLLISKLIECTVTPTTLRDVIEDWLLT